MPFYQSYTPENPYNGDLTSDTPEMRALRELYRDARGELSFTDRRAITVSTRRGASTRHVLLRMAWYLLRNAWEREHRRALRIAALQHSATAKVRECALCGQLYGRLRIDRHPVTFAVLFPVDGTLVGSRAPRVPATRICSQCGHMLGYINSRGDGVSDTQSTLALVQWIISDPLERQQLLKAYGPDLRRLGAYLRAHGGYGGGFRPRGRRPKIARVMDAVDAADAAVNASRIPNT